VPYSYCRPACAMNCAACGSTGCEPILLTAIRRMTRLSLPEALVTAAQLQEAGSPSRGRVVAHAVARFSVLWLVWLDRNSCVPTDPP
jgi:hypothetical protein